VQEGENMELENRMLIDEYFEQEKDYEDDDYYNDAPDWFEEED
jgi:hypothetical protein